MQEPARCGRRIVISALAVEPGPQPFAAFDAEIIARGLLTVRIAPPLHGYAFRTFRCRDLMQHVPPAKSRRRAVGDFRDHLHRLRPSEQTHRASWREAILFLTSPRLRGEVAPTLPSPACGGGKGG